MREPANSIYIIDQPRHKIYSYGKLTPFRNHPACIFSKKNELIYVIGGEFRGTWVADCSTISIYENIQNDLKQESLPYLPQPLFGPSAAIIEKDGILTIFAAGGNLTVEQTCIYKLT